MGPEAGQADFDAYRRTLAEGARDSGMDRARRADPDTFDEALRAIRTLAASGLEFAADEVRILTTPTSSTGVLGAAFRQAHKLGWIRPVGARASRLASRHAGLQRTWRGAS
jgi:hypothetical protein